MVFCLAQPQFWPRTASISPHSLNFGLIQPRFCLTASISGSHSLNLASQPRFWPHTASISASHSLEFDSQPRFRPQKASILMQNLRFEPGHKIFVDISCFLIFFCHEIGDRLTKFLEKLSGGNKLIAALIEHRLKCHDCNNLGNICFICLQIEIKIHFFPAEITEIKTNSYKKADSARFLNGEETK